jgi:hypothetical protein
MTYFQADPSNSIAKIAQAIKMLKVLCVHACSRKQHLPGQSWALVQ